ncbi:hypothetical protein Tco_1367699 [Tanacetum coccineum]
MNPIETQQIVARDEKWVPSTERVKISSTNVRLETTVQQKEETFQVVIDVIKNSTCFKAFTITAEKCIVDAEVFRKILDICPRIESEEFTEVQDDDATLTFLIDLGCKCPLHKYTNMYADHMHQPWRTLAAIINKCLFGKTASNDRLRKSRISIIHFLSQHKSLFNLKYQHYHTIKDDGIVSRLKFVRIGEDYQEYGLAIPNMMLNDAIKQSESYQMFLKYSTGQIPPKKSRGKARKRTASRRVVKKKVIISVADNIILDPDVALELDKSISFTEATEEKAARQVHATHARIVTESEAEPAKKKTGSRSTRGVVIEDTPNAPKPKPATSKLKLKGV